MDGLINLASGAIIFYLLVAIVAVTAVVSVLYTRREDPRVRTFLEPFYRLIGAAPPVNDPIRQQRNAIIETAEEVRHQLKQSKLPDSRKSSIQHQIDLLLSHVDKTCEAIRRVKKLQSQSNLADSDDLHQLVFSLDTRLEDVQHQLQGLLIYMLDVDTKVDERRYLRLMQELDETNKSLSDLSDSQKAINRLRQH